MGCEKSEIGFSFAILFAHPSLLLKVVFAIRTHLKTATDRGTLVDSATEARNAIKDEANCVSFAQFIEAREDP